MQWSVAHFTQKLNLGALGQESSTSPMVKRAVYAEQSVYEAAPPRSKALVQGGYEAPSKYGGESFYDNEEA